jgi:HD-like signal output (HDOD) protein
LSIFNKIFKEKSSDEQVSKEVPLDTLKKLIPIRSLSEEKLLAFDLTKQAEFLPENVIIFELGQAADKIYYLLEGAVELEDANGKSYEIIAGTGMANFPLSGGTKPATTATTKTNCYLLSVSQKIMASGQVDLQKKQQLDFPPILAKSELIQAFSQHYSDDELEIPSLPKVAVNLRKAMVKDIGIAEAVEIIQLDQVISAKLIEVANCPLFITKNPAKTCFEAVNRIGLNATKNLVTTLSVKQIFQSKNLLIKKLMERIWKQSIFISSICFVLATEAKHLNADEALLAGLVSDIGLIPFLDFAANLPDDYYTEQELKQALPYIRGSVGATILRQWDFPEELINIPLYADDWYHNKSEKLDLTDVVILARLHSKIGKPGMTGLPAITSIPAASKLTNVTPSPENSLQIIHEAKHKINEALKVF